MRFDAGINGIGALLTWREQPVRWVLIIYRGYNPAVHRNVDGAVASRATAAVKVYCRIGAVAKPQSCPRLPC